MTDMQGRVTVHRARLRAQGFRPVQIWVPDVRSPGFARDALQQSQAVSSSSQADADQDFADDISDWPGGLRLREIWMVSGGPDFAGKSRPCVIVQDGHFVTGSVTVCPFLTDSTDAPAIPAWVAASDKSRLSSPSRLMVDKITTVRQRKLGSRVGALADADIVRLNRATVTFPSAIIGGYPVVTFGVFDSREGIGVDSNAWRGE